jgi:hypothetical protein
MRFSLNSEVEECENVVLFWNQQPVHSQANFVEVVCIPLKVLKPKEIGIIGETNIGIEVQERKRVRHHDIFAVFAELFYRPITSRTLRARLSTVNGFCRKAASGFRMP